jgi:hypothetical protein
MNWREIKHELAGVYANRLFVFRIATGQLYVDLAAAALAEPSDVRVYSCRDAALACSPPQERPIRNSCDPSLQISCASMWLTPNSAASEIIKRLHEASEDALRVANERSEMVRRYLNGDPQPVAGSIPLRTLQRWLSEYRAAKRFWSTGYGRALSRIREGRHRAWGAVD